jgi:glycosyltransferase involved in cell wall biosynthesis
MDGGYSSMNLLFIHGNFPGQFKDIAPELASRVNGKTYFLSLSDNPQNIVLPRVQFRQFKLHRDVRSETHAYVQATELAVLKGQAVLRALDQLHKQEGFIPDVVICHGGMGFGLFVKSLLPSVRLISYLEWYFTPSNSRELILNPTIDDFCRLECRNIPILQELAQADQLVCPTRWQRDQFPGFIKDRIQVVFDGVDIDFFSPGLPVDPLVLKADSDAPLQFTSDQLLLTYGTRGMEPLRGFPEFMRAAAAAQQAFPHLQVVVFGNDRAAYGYPSPHESGSWKQYMLDELAGQLDLARLHFTGLLNYGELVQLFRRSDLHCYFTRPYVVSWGVFQAAACGARLLVNDFPGIDDVFASQFEAVVIDLDHQVLIDRAIIKLLKSGKKEQVCSNLAEGMELSASIMKWLNLISHKF